MYALWGLAIEQQAQWLHGNTYNLSLQPAATLLFRQQIAYLKYSQHRVHTSRHGVHMRGHQTCLLVLLSLVQAHMLVSAR